MFDQELIADLLRLEITSCCSGHSFEDVEAEIHDTLLIYPQFTYQIGERPYFVKNRTYKNNCLGMLRLVDDDNQEIRFLIQCISIGNTRGRDEVKVQLILQRK